MKFSVNPNTNHVIVDIPTLGAAELPPTLNTIIDASNVNTQPATQYTSVALGNVDATNERGSSDALSQTLLAAPTGNWHADNSSANLESHALLPTNPDTVITIETPLALALDRIRSANHSHQLDAMYAEIFPTESFSAEQALQLMRAYADRHQEITNSSSYFYQSYLSMHRAMESIIPYPFRAGGNVSLHLLLQALFFNGQFNSTASSSTATTATANYSGFLFSTMPLTMDQVRSFGDAITALFFHFPTLLYQYPKLRDEVKQCIEQKKISGSVISRVVMCTASLLLTIAPIVMLGGSMQAGNIVRYIGRGISYIDIPIVIICLLQSWHQAYKNQDPSQPASRFMSNEIAFKTTQRVLTQALSLFSSLSGSILRSQHRGTATDIAPLFGLNIINLFFHQNPFEGVTIGANLLKRPVYQHDKGITLTQTVGLMVDLSALNKIIPILTNNGDRAHYAFNLPRLSGSQQTEFLRQVLIACTSGDRAILSQDLATLAIDIVEDIYSGRFNPSSIESIPEPFPQFLTYLNQLRMKDSSNLSCGNAVNEYLIAVLIKTLSFREFTRGQEQCNQ